MSKTTGKLGYNYDNKRMGILSFDLWVRGKEGLHCGEMLEVYIKDEWVADRLELSGSEWYLVNTNLKGDQLEGLNVTY